MFHWIRALPILLVGAAALATPSPDAFARRQARKPSERKVPTHVYLYKNEVQGRLPYGLHEESWQSLAVLKQGSLVQAYLCLGDEQTLEDPASHFQHYCKEFGSQNPLACQSVFHQPADGLYNIQSGYLQRLGTQGVMSTVASLVFNEKDPRIVTVLSQHTQTRYFGFPTTRNRRITLQLVAELDSRESRIRIPHRNGDQHPGEVTQLDPTCQNDTFTPDI